MKNRRLFLALLLLLCLSLCVSLSSCSFLFEDDDGRRPSGGNNAGNVDDNGGGNGNGNETPNTGNNGNGGGNTNLETPLNVWVDQEILYPAINYQIGVGPGFEWEFDASLVTWELRDNTAEAVMENGVVTAAKSGSVTVVASHPMWKSGALTLHFAEIAPLFPEYERPLYVGELLPLEFRMPIDMPGFESVSYAVSAGNASIITNESGQQLLKAGEAGEVSVEITAVYGGVEFKAVDTLSFVGHNFTIHSANTVEFVGYDVPMSALCDTIGGFNAGAVVYHCDNESVTVNGTTIKSMAAGSITVTATYLYNDVPITTSVVLTFEYDENTIMAVEDLEKLRDSDKIFHLLADLDLGTAGTWNPINGFSGTLYGNGHKISGLTLSATRLGEPVGLFGTLSGTVENLTIDGTLSSAAEIPQLGLLCGVNKGTVRDITATGTVNATYGDYVGGIIGLSENANIFGCTSSVAVTARNYVGGIAGEAWCARTDGLVLEGLTNHGEIVGESSVGGVIGNMCMQSYSTNATVVINAFLNDAAVNGSGDNVGGIFGRIAGNYHDDWNDTIAYFKITACKNEGEISGLNRVGGIIGYSSNYVSELSLCTNTKGVSGERYVGGFAGRADGTVMKDLTNTVTVTGQANVGGIGGYVKGAENCTNNGTLSVNGYYTDDNGTKLSYVGGIAGEASNVFNCTNNAAIDVNAGGWYVAGIVGYLNATRDAAVTVQGNANHGEVKGTDFVGGIAGAMHVQYANSNHIITVNANTNDGVISGTKSSIGGIFGYVTGEQHKDWDWYTATIKITGCSNEAAVSGVDYVGGIVGHAPAHVSEIALCTNSDSVTGNLYVGGIAGRAAGVTLRDMENKQTITGKAYVGGIAGEAGMVESCVNRGSVINVDYHMDNDLNKLSYLGGIVGYANGISDCTNEKEIDASTGGKYVGGIVGFLAKSRTAGEKVDGNKNHGAITGTEYVGGIAGYMEVKSANNNDIITVSGNVNDGVISGSGDCVGGILGYVKGESHKDYDWYTSVVKISDCSNEAAVSGKDYVGGIVGYAPTLLSEISLCKNLDDVTGNLYVGGFAGRADGTAMTSLKNSYTVTGKAYVGGIAGLAGVVSGCENSGTITLLGYLLDSGDSSALSYAGGIAGYATGASACTNNKALDASLGGKYVGGIVGYLAKNRSEGEKVDGNKNHGAIKGTEYVGGIVGFMAVQSANNNHVITVSGNVNDATVSGTGNCVGGILGYVRGEQHKDYDWYTSWVKISDCSNEAAISGVDYVGGIVGYAPSFVSEISICKNLDDVSGNDYVGGFAGRADGTTLTGLKNTNAVTGRMYLGGVAGLCGKLSACEFSGTLTVTGYYMDINSNEMLSYVGGVAGYATDAAGCTNSASIDATKGGKYVGGIVGYLAKGRVESEKVDGNKNSGAIKGTEYVGGIAGFMAVQTANNNHAITVSGNVNSGAVSGTKDCVGGIFGYVRGEQHKDHDWYTSWVKISDCSNTAAIAGNDYVGGIVGYAPSYVSELSISKNTGDVSGHDYVGGFAGCAGGTAMTSLKNANAVTGRMNVGGIAGHCGKLSACEFSGTLTVTGAYLNTDDNTLLSYVGGLAGYATGAAGCTNSASIDATNGGRYVGGIVGFLAKSRSASDKVENNKNLGSIKGIEYVGGIAGYMGVSYANNNDTVIVSGNTNAGAVTGSGNWVGGIFGYVCGEQHKDHDWYTSTVKILECTGTGDVTGADYVGGIVGCYGDFVDLSEVIWNTNQFSASISATGENKGDKYGNLVVSA